ncbi:MAG: branched-chain amino acid ABC transporter substrate-binding protein [Paracoccus sp. (in: a-proteobacteria)]|nr:branched-chain amino acid ABC transporter substrate-binding protein [Paracoccus sp. (in: a-proteobacteria)]
MSIFHKTRRGILIGMALGCTMFALPAMADKPTVKLGFIGPLSGGNAQQGLGARGGFLLAVEQANANPDLPFQIEPVILDDASDPQTGVSAAMRLVNDPDVIGATGHWNSSVALATMPVFARFGVPLVVWGAISPEITRQNLPQVTRVTPTLLTENKPLMEWAVNELGARRIAIVADTSDYGKANADSINEFTPEAGGEVVSVDQFPVGSTDFRAIITRLKSADIDAVYFGGVITEAGIFARQMHELELDKPILGISGIYDSELIAIAGPAAENVIVSYPAAAQTPRLEQLEADYTAAGYADPSNPYTKFAFDGANVIILAAAAAGTEDKAALAAAIRGISHDGASGVITFDESGQTETPIEIRKHTVRNGEWVEYSAD